MLMFPNENPKVPRSSKCRTPSEVEEEAANVGNVEDAESVAARRWQRVRMLRAKLIIVIKKQLEKHT